MGKTGAGMCLALALCLMTPVASLATPVSPREPIRVTWKNAGVSREALVYLPVAGLGLPAPVLFAFHGHGGTPEVAARSFRFHEIWPEAIVVYPKGLPTPGSVTDPEGKKPGWQSRTSEQGDRDLAFFDAMLKETTQIYGGDRGRVFAAGHSNGGSFVYLLWAVRSETLAAVAPSGAILSDRSVALSPKPAFHTAGRSDPLVKFAWQERMIEEIRKVNRCVEGKPWRPFCTLFPSEIGTPVVTYVHPGGHDYPTEASEAIVNFFKEVPRR
jgi:polyhydroxybutyrate depolymerase